jgi:membrane protease YdiL (CAAX protease family)
MQAENRPVAPPTSRSQALVSMAAALIAVGLADAPVRLFFEGPFTRWLEQAGYNAAITRYAAMVGARFTEVVAVYAVLRLFYRLARFGSLGELGLCRRTLGWLPVGVFVPLLAVVSVAGLALTTGLLQAHGVIWPGPWPVLIALAAATHAAWIEELIFRGILRRGIEQAWNRAAAILVTAALFTAMHLFAPFHLTSGWWIVVALAGVGLAWFYYVSGGSLWLPIGLHWGFDLWVFLVFGLPNETRGAILWYQTGRTFPVQSQEIGWALAVVALLTGLMMFVILRARGPVRVKAS